MQGPAEPPTIVDLFGLKGHKLEGRYRIDRVVAEGGFGVVYEGWHLGLDVRVAVKVLKSPEAPTEAARAVFIEKFLAEAKTMARIRHPNIVQVLDTGVSPMPSGIEAPWMAMEWLSGDTLHETLVERGAQPPAAVLALLQPAIEAIAYAHEEGIAHRDIKPENVMMVETRRGLSPRVLDFGIAKLMLQGEHAGSGVTNTQSQVNAFSPLYGSPEQLGRARTGPWTDVHALGLVLTQALTGKQPLPSNDLTVTFREVLAEVRPTPAKFGVDVGSWEPVLAKAVAFRPDARFQSAGELLAALQAALPGARHEHAGRAESVTGDYGLPSSRTKGPTAPAPQHSTTLASHTVIPEVKSGDRRTGALVAALAGVLGGAAALTFAVRHLGPAAVPMTSAATAERRALAPSAPEPTHDRNEGRLSPTELAPLRAPDEPRAAQAPGSTGPDGAPARVPSAPTARPSAAGSATPRAPVAQRATPTARVRPGVSAAPATAAAPAETPAATATAAPVRGANGASNF